MNALVTGVCKPQRLLVGPTTFASARFNAGHSVLLWLLYDHSKLKVTAFDLANHPYPPHAVEWLPKRFGPRLEVVMGTSVETVPAYAAMHPDVACDVLFIDGGHFDPVSTTLPTPSFPPQYTHTPASRSLRTHEAPIAASFAASACSPRPDRCR
jgi:hypothetical protein